MSIKEKLKAEIERLKEKYTNMMPSIQKCSVCDELLSFLATLEEEPVELEKEIEKFLDESGAPYVWCNDEEQKEWCGIIANHFYELGRQSKEQPVCEGLDEAAKQYVEKMKFSSIQSFEGAFKAGAEWQKDKDTRDMYMSDNRHFQKIYELGRKEEREQMMKEAVEGRVTYYLVRTACDEVS